MLFDVLSMMGKALNKADILWGLGGSVLLHHYGIARAPKDIDVFIGLDDIETADGILCALGEKRVWERSEAYDTKYFYEYVIDGVDVDVMAGFVINHCNGKYSSVFSPESIHGTATVNETEIPLMSLEDWYVIYQLIPGRENKVDRIENYLKELGISRSDHLHSALARNLPAETKQRIESLLKTDR